MDSNTVSIERLQISASEKYKQGELVEAVTLYTQAIQLDINQPDWVYGNVITILAQLDKLAEANSWSRKALQIYSDSDEIYRAISISFRKQGKEEDCLKCYRKAIEINEEQPKWVYVNFLGDLRDRGLIAEAKNIAETRIAKHPEDRDLISLLNVSSRSTNSVTTETSQNPPLNEESDRTSWLIIEASKKYDQQDLSSAVELYQRAIKLDPQQPDWVYGNVITILAKLGNFKGVNALIEASLGLYPNSDAICTAIGILEGSQGNIQASIDSYQKAIRINPHQPAWLYTEVLSFLVEQDYLAQAVELGYRAVKNITTESQLEWIYYRLGEALYKQQKYQESITYFRETTKLNPDFSWAYYYLGEACSALQEWDTAFAAYCRVLQLAPELSDVGQKLNYTLDKRAKLDLLKKQKYYQEEIHKYPDRLCNYHDALKLKIGSADIYLNFVEALQRKGESEKVVAFSKLYQQIKP